MNSFFTKLFLLICWLSVTCEVEGQILPPDFLCVKGDTIFWNPTANSCGAFESYDIFTANSPQGPFMPLVQVSDQSRNFYFHSNPFDEQRYYYLESNHNCPGIPRAQSDTLDNRSPEITEIETVTVIGDDVLIEWSENLSKATAGYIIYRLTPIGTIPIDTVYNMLSYTDMAAEPREKSETYYVLAFDLCGNTSLFDNPHQTMYMTGTTAECEQRIDLKWNPYTSWSSGVERQEIWIGEAGAMPQLVENIGGLDSTYTIENAADGREYCVFVRAIAAGSQVVSVTNQLCIEPEIVNPISELLIKNLDVQSDGSVEVTWLWNTDARLKSAELAFWIESDDVINLETFDVSSSPLLRENRITVGTGFADREITNFQWFTSDDCDTSATSSIGNPIFLTVAANGLSNNLAWTPLVIDSAQVQSYDLFKIENGSPTNIFSGSENDFEFADILDVNEVTGEDLCYFVRATSVFTFSDGRTQTITSKSNEVCQPQTAKIWMPNAFNPRGRNQTFKPVLAFGAPKTYRMRIFDRWGKVIFETDEISQGWNGKNGIQDVPSGVYTYLVQMTAQDGAEENFSGPVMLVR